MAIETSSSDEDGDGNGDDDDDTTWCTTINSTAYE